MSSFLRIRRRTPCLSGAQDTTQRGYEPTLTPTAADRQTVAAFSRAALTLNCLVSKDVARVIFRESLDGSGGMDAPSR
jgi:hypothetical protein